MNPSKIDKLTKQMKNETSVHRKNIEDSLKNIATSINSTSPPKKKMTIFIEIVFKYVLPILSLSVSISLFWLGRNYTVSMNTPSYTLKNYPVRKISMDGISAFSLSPYRNFGLDKNNNSGEANSFFLARFLNDKIDLISLKSTTLPPTRDSELKDLTMFIPSEGESIPFQLLQGSIQTKEKHFYGSSYHKETINKDSDLVLNLFDNSYTTNTFGNKASTYVGFYHLVILGKNKNYQVITFIPTVGGKEANFEDTTNVFYDLEIFDLNKWQNSEISDLKEDVIKSYEKTLQFIKEKKL